MVSLLTANRFSMAQKNAHLKKKMFFTEACYCSHARCILETSGCKLNGYCLICANTVEKHLSRSNLAIHYFYKPLRATLRIALWEPAGHGARRHGFGFIRRVFKEVMMRRRGAHTKHLLLLFLWVPHRAPGCIIFSL